MDGPATKKKYNRKKEEAERLGIGLRTLERWMAGRRIPYRQIGKIVLFDPIEVDKFLDRCRVSPVGDSGPAAAQLSN